MRPRPVYILMFIICLYIFILPQENPKPKIKCNYLLYLPESYQNDTAAIPLLIYLHGGSHRGNDLNKLKGYGLPSLIDKGHNYNFIIASPQCPDTTYWSRVDWFDSLYNELTSKYRIDKNRVYVTGISMGGYGAWHAAMDFPDKIAAIVPLCGGCNDSLEICRINHIPVWTFHGTADTTIRINETECLVNRLNNCNGNVRFTRIENAGHDITYIFEKQEIYNWLLEQRRK